MAVVLLAADGLVLPLWGALLANAECWLDCLAVLVPAAAGVPVCMPVGLRVLRGLGRGLILLCSCSRKPSRDADVMSQKS